MYRELEGRIPVFTIGIVNPKTSAAPRTSANYYSDCPKRPGVTKGSFDMRELRRIKRFIKNNGINCIYFESLHLWNAFVMGMCRSLYKIQAVHDVIPHDGNKGMYLCNKVTCNMSNHIVLRNKKYKDTLADMYRVPGEKISCIDLWRLYPEFNYVEPSEGILFFGRLRKYKGLGNLKEIVKRLPEVSFEVMGSSDDESRKMATEIASFPNVKLEDRELSEAEMVEVFLHNKWVILPYESATQSGVIVDACKYGRPAIAYNVGAISEQIDDQVSGFLVPEGDIEAFIDNVKKASEMDADEYKDFSTAAYLQGYRKYSASHAVDKFLALFNQG